MFLPTMDVEERYSNSLDGMGLVPIFVNCDQHSAWPILTFNLAWHTTKAAIFVDQRTGGREWGLEQMG